MVIQQNNLQDLTISGSGNAVGGTYNDVTMSGSSKLNGDVHCNDLKISGSSTVNGKVNAQKLKVSGSTTFNDNIEAERVNISGSSVIKGNVNAGEMVISGSGYIHHDLHCNSLRSSGSFKVGGNITGGEVKTSGACKVKGDCEIERFKSSGSVQIDGLLNADKIAIKLGYPSRVKEIGGASVVIEKEKYISIFQHIIALFSLRKYRLEAELIEGDEVRIELTNAKLVRGKHVIIGPKCDIAKVEYTDSLTVSNHAQVSEQLKI